MLKNWKYMLVPDKTYRCIILAFYKKLKVFCWVSWKVSNGGGYKFKANVRPIHFKSHELYPVAVFSGRFEPITSRISVRQ